MKSPLPPPSVEPTGGVQRIAGPMHRTSAGWALLVLSFLLYLVIMLAPIHAVSSALADPYVAIESGIRTQMYLKSTTTYLEQFGQSAMTGSSPVDLNTIRKLQVAALKDPRAQRLLVADQYESGLRPSPAALRKLSTSKIAASRALAAVYSSSSLTNQQARELAAKMPNDEFAYRLAKVHAFGKAGDKGPRLALAPLWRGMAIILIGMAALFVGFMGVVVWIVYFSMRSSGKLAPMGHPAEPLTMPEVDRFAFRGGTVMLTFLGLNLLSALMLAAAGVRSEALLMLVLFGLMFVAVIAIHKVPALDMWIPLSRIGVTKKDFGRHVLWGLAGYVAAVPGVIVAALIGNLLIKIFGEPTHPATQMIEAGPSPLTIFALFFSAAIIAPFWEEIMFRGTLLPALSGIFKRPLWGILASSFVFAAIHPQGVPLWLALGFIGAMNGMLAYQTKSLVPCMVLHALNNGLVLIFALIAS